MKKLNILFIIFILSLVTFSCKKDGYKAPASNTVNMAGRWWTELLFDSNQDGVFNEADGDEIIYHYEDYGVYALTSTNTASNSVDTVIITDSHAASSDRWPFKIKAPVNYGNLTFTPSTVENLDVEDGTAKIISGKILKGAARSKSGAVADSIFIEFEFSDDEGSYYIFAGHRDSGQPEDQY